MCHHLGILSLIALQRDLYKPSSIKTLPAGEEIECALLSCITTPISDDLPSPTELLNSRKFRSRLSVPVAQPEQHRDYRNAMKVNTKKVSAVQ